MKKINNLFKNKKILILSKEEINFEKGITFNDEINDIDEPEYVYQQYVYKSIDNNFLTSVLINENNYEINLCHVWKFEEFFFISKDEKYCECLDNFVLFQVMTNDYDLVPEYLINYAKRYEKLTAKLEKLDEKGLFETKEYKDIQEQVHKLLCNAQKRTYNKTYIGKTIVIEIKN